MVGRFINPDTGKPIHPDIGNPNELLRASIIINNPVRMKWRIATGERLPGQTANDYGRGLVHEDFEENLTGLFGIDANFLDWDLNGKANGTFGGRTRACFYRGEITYKVSGPLTIDRDKLVVTAEDLKHYLEITGNQAELPENNTNSWKNAVLHAPLFIQKNQVIRLPRLDYYTPEELAEYWREELGITNAPDSRVWHYVHVGKLKTSLRYEYPDGRGWFFDEAPARTSMIDILNAPPAEKYYIRLQDAERFEKEHFRTSEPKPLLPEKELKIESVAINSTEIKPEQSGKIDDTSNEIPDLVESVSTMVTAEEQKALRDIQIMSDNKERNNCLVNWVRNYAADRQMIDDNQLLSELVANNKIPALTAGIAFYPANGHKTKKDKDSLESFVWRRVNHKVKPRIMRKIVT